MPALRRVNRMSGRIGSVLLACAFAAACATGSALRAAQRAERLQDYDLAVVEYTKAVRANPNDQNARTALQRARLRVNARAAQVVQKSVTGLDL